MYLIPADPRDIAEKIGLDWWAAKKLYDEKWLSFDPEIETLDSVGKEAEFIFLGSLVAAGCDPRMLRRLLSNLQKPYCYNLSSIYYDWPTRSWVDFPNQDAPSQIAAKIITELEDDGDVDSLEELRDRVQEAITRLTDDDQDDDVSDDRYAFNAEQDSIVSSVRQLLSKIAASALVDTPSKTIVIGKLFKVFQSLPKVTQDEDLSLSLVSPRRNYGEHEICHCWEIRLSEEGELRVSSTGDFWRPRSGHDSFTSMTWEVSPGCEPILEDYHHTLSLCDDADTFENEVMAMDLDAGGYKLSVEDSTIDECAEEENDLNETSNPEEATPASASWIVLPCDAADRRLAARIDHRQVDENKEAFAYGAEICDFCKCVLDKRGLYVDGGIRNDAFCGANMCAPCFEKHGAGIGWGVGQIYARQPNGGWRLVAGFMGAARSVTKGSENTDG